VRDILRVAYLTGLTFVQIVNLRHCDLTPELSAILSASESSASESDPDAYIFYPGIAGTPRPMARLRNDYFRAQQALAGRLGLHGLLSIPRVRHLSPRTPK